MVVSLYFLVLFLFIGGALLAYKHYRFIKVTKEHNKAQDKELADLKSKQEDVDVWKKACWDAEKRHSNMSIIYQETDELLVKAYAEIDKVVNQKKSSEVKLGMISENALAFIQELPYNFQNMRQLGSPVDYIYFNTDGQEAEVVIVEVKSNKSKETKKQRLIRSAVLSGRVYYEVVRINESGVSIIRAKNEEDLD
jgi:predicted Holliday junction resolvase-like endonuclease